MVKTTAKEQKKINDCLRLLSNNYRVDINTIRLSVANTLEHELAKTIKAYELIKDGNQIVTEAVFKGGGRADILCLNKFQVFEILHSETKKKALRKLDTYPKELTIFFIDSSEQIDRYGDGI